jgi:ribosomal protein L11 methyltransferase
MSDSYYSLTIELPETEAEVLQAFLPDWGASTLEVRDREAPPMPGVRGPNPGEVLVVASFSTEEAVGEAVAEVQARWSDARCEVARADQQDWSVAWRTRIQATHVGRLWVGPPWLLASAPSAVHVVIEPKMAFGTGDHPTTRLCLAAVDDFMCAHSGASVLDVGTGSGVLAIAAAKLGAGRVVGVDNDGPSIELAQENAALNETARVELSEKALPDVPGKFDLVLANILANTLTELAPQIAAHVGKRLVLAGVLRHQREEVARAFVAQGLVDQGGTEEGEWVRLDFSAKPSGA